MFQKASQALSARLTTASTSRVSLGLPTSETANPPMIAPDTLDNFHHAKRSRSGAVGILTDGLATMRRPQYLPPTPNLGVFLRRRCAPVHGFREVKQIEKPTI